MDSQASGDALHVPPVSQSHLKLARMCTKTHLNILFQKDEAAFSEAAFGDLTEDGEALLLDFKLYLREIGKRGPMQRYDRKAFISTNPPRSSKMVKSNEKERDR